MKTTLTINNNKLVFNTGASVNSLLNGREFTTTEISEYVTNKMIEAGIDRVMSGKVIMLPGVGEHDTTTVGAYAFIRPESEDIIHTKIPENLKDLVKPTYKASEKLNEIMKIFCDPDTMEVSTHTVKDTPLFFIKLNILKVLCEYVKSESQYVETSIMIDDFKIIVDTDKDVHELLHNKEFNKKDVCGYVTRALKYADIDGVLSTEIVTNHIDFNASVYTFFHHESKDINIVTINPPEQFKELVEPRESCAPSYRLEQEIIKYCSIFNCEVRSYKRNGRTIVYILPDIVKVLCEYVKSNQ